MKMPMMLIVMAMLAGCAKPVLKVDQSPVKTGHEYHTRQLYKCYSLTKCEACEARGGWLDPTTCECVDLRM